MAGHPARPSAAARSPRPRQSAGRLEVVLTRVRRAGCTAARPGDRHGPAAPPSCPWDREQTHRSLATYLLEETYEVLEAIDSGDRDHLREELGDLLLQVVLPRPDRRGGRRRRASTSTTSPAASPTSSSTGTRTCSPASTVADADEVDAQLGAAEGGREAARLACSTASRRRCPAWRSPTRSLGRLRAPGSASSPSPPDAGWGSGCWRWSSRPAPPASTPSRRCATPCAGLADAGPRDGDGHRLRRRAERPALTGCRRSACTGRVGRRDHAPGSDSWHDAWHPARPALAVRVAPTRPTRAGSLGSGSRAAGLGGAPYHTDEEVVLEPPEGSRRGRQLATDSLFLRVPEEKSRPAAATRSRPRAPPSSARARPRGRGPGVLHHRR